MKDNPNPLAGTQWILHTLQGEQPITGTQITLNFDAEGRVTGADGCNRFFGPYQVADDALIFSQLGGTMMACPPEVMAQSRDFTRALMSTKTFEVAEGALTLLDASGTVLATFTALNTDLAGTHWNVLSYNNGRQAVVSLIAGTSITLAFGTAEPGKDARVTGNSGCNNFSGAFAQGAQGEDSIAFGALASTRKLCVAPEGVMEQEAQFLKALETASTFRMDGDRLEFRTAENALAVSLRRAP